MYHKPPTAFVEGTGGLKRVLPKALGEDTIVGPGAAGASVIPEPGSLIGDLLSMDLGGGGGAQAGGAAGAEGNVDLLSGGLDNLLTGGAASAPGGAGPSNNSLLGDIFGLGGSESLFVALWKAVWGDFERFRLRGVTFSKHKFACC